MYWYVEYDETPRFENTKTFLIENSNFMSVKLTANLFIGSGKCTIVPLTVEHLIKKHKFHNRVSVFS